ncbi:hypothetical protein I3I95_07005 [bacterium]|nr:hypothetical protein [bacterium]
MIIHPSVSETFDLDERQYNDDVAADLRRSYLPIGPVRVRRHEATDPAHNTMELAVRLAKPYWHEGDEGAAEVWPQVRAWLESKGYFFSATMKSFNRTRGAKGDQTVTFDRVDVQMGPYTLQVSVTNDVLPAIDEVADTLRGLLNGGALADLAVTAVRLPSAASLSAQLEALATAEAQEAADEARAEASQAAEARDVEKVADAGADGADAQADDAGVQAGDAQAAEAGATVTSAADDVAADAQAQEDEGEEYEPPVNEVQLDYRLWDVVLADGTVRTLDSVTGEWR